MDKEFIPYEQALALKELGFNEPCIAYATMEYKDVVHCGIGFKVHKESDLPTKPFGVPTWQSAFRWFRERYRIFSSIWCFETEQKFFIEFGFGIHKFEVVNKEEAELECLKKLIQIVKESKS
jgi:hypothetical protein